MRFANIAVLCTCLCLAFCDVIHLKSAKARLISSLVGKAKHHKRGVLSSVPPFKLGHDIPLVSHSLLKPLVVTYPPTATVATVKVPLTHPLLSRYPVPVGHRVPVPHPHYGLKFPHTTKSVFLSKPDHHFHHHHHHVAPKPLVPIVPVAPAPVPIPAPVPLPAPVPVPVPPPLPTANFIPIAQPTAAVAHPAPSPPVLVHQAPAVSAHPVPIGPTPLQIVPQNHLHYKPLLPATVPIQAASVLPTPLFQYAQQFPYVLRPGGAVQTSVFATYPRYPLVNYQSPLLPLSPLAPVAHSPGQVLLNRPQVLLQRPQVLLERPQVPQFHLLPQPGVQGAVLHHAHTNVAVGQTPTLLHPSQAAFPSPTFNIQPAAVPQPAVHLQPTQPSTTLDNEGWTPVTTNSHDLTPTQIPEPHFPQPQPHHQFTQEQGTQVYEHHTGEGNYNDLHHQLQQHIQQQIEQAQYEQNLNNHNHQFATSQQPGQEYGVPNQDFSQQNHDYAYHGQEYAPHDQQYIPNDQQYISNSQNFGQNDQHYIPQEQQFNEHDQQFSQHDQQFAQHDQLFAQHDQQFNQHDQQFAQPDHQFSQHDQQYPQQDQQFAQHDQQFGQSGQGYDLAQPTQEYGLPQQGLEGRNDDAQESDQQYHNHIPLGLQLPINEPLDHFR